MLDIHCHIIHAVDDGAKTIDESIAMAKIAAKDGVRTIVATPHIGAKIISSDDIRNKVDELNDRLIELFIPVEILPGAEIISGIPVELIEKYTINGNGFVLIEFPHSHLPHNSFEIIRNITSHGLKPLIAHPERNPSIIKQPEILVDLVEKSGVGIQLTANSITGSFGRRIRKCSQYLLKKRVVHIIASDAHSENSRKPGLSLALKEAAKILGRKHAQKLVYDNPEAVINGGTLS